jgi:hypothetical protein
MIKFLLSRYVAGNLQALTLKLCNRDVKQAANRQDKGSTTVALVGERNQKNVPVPYVVRSD